jgi:hypothetical protein
MKTLLSFIALALMATPSVASPELVFMADGEKVTLSTEDRTRVIKKIEEIVTSANFNSRDHAEMFTKADETYWRPLDQIRSGSHILLRYTTPHDFKTVGGKITATEVWMDLQKEPRSAGGAVYPGPITLVNEGGSIKLTKEGGYLVLGLGLDPAVYPHLPKIIQETMDRGRKAYEEFEKKKDG